SCQKMQKFPPYTSITVSVKFTKILYAQIVSQRLNAPKPFIMPLSTSKKYPAAELGMKLACGFEILCIDKYYTGLSSKPNKLNTEVIHPSFLNSILYKQLEKIAKEQFLKYQKNSSPLEQIDEILKLPMVSDEVLMSNIKQDDD
ncbi:16533_t:CDS:2, partial [Racocetra fulgida]